MTREAVTLLTFALMAVNYAAFAVVAWHRRGPGRRSVAAAGACGVSGTVIPILSSVSDLTGGPDVLNSVPEAVGLTMIVGAFTAFVLSQILLVVGLLRAWRGREADDLAASRPVDAVEPLHA